jgi:mRNA-degrading endonuclease toxin of MazEF toxin-antitoxin module
MKRGDVVTVAAAGDYGKPRPAVIVQTDALARGTCVGRGQDSDGKESQK